MNRATGKVTYAVVNIKLTNVDEAPQIYDQTVAVGRDGSRGLIWFNDPDSMGYPILWVEDRVMNANGLTTVSGTSTSGPHEMRIVSGDSQGIFAIEPGFDAGWGSAMRIKLVKPNLLAGRTSFTLKVQLLEKGKLASEATIRVEVADHVNEYYQFYSNVVPIRMA